MDRDREAKISHVFREGNTVVDFLAHLGHSLELGRRLNFLMSHVVELAILSDCMGVNWFPTFLCRD
ncbi:hypothetical protein LINPERHAP2_LOCUS32324 [Linum perenne]